LSTTKKRIDDVQATMLTSEQFDTSLHHLLAYIAVVLQLQFFHDGSVRNGGQPL